VEQKLFLAKKPQSESFSTIWEILDEGKQQIDLKDQEIYLLLTAVNC
jgi:hypothetical protein